MMVLLADVPERSRFNLTYRDVFELPLGLRDAMLEQIEQWRAQEKSAAAKARG